MTQALDLVVVIPIGPDEVVEYVLDTIDSVTHYAGAATRIIVVDDSTKDTGAVIQSRASTVVDVVKTPRNQGLHGGLYLTLSRAYLYALANYDFKVMLRLDVDALVIGERPEVDAIRFFEQHPKAGIIGLHGHGTSPDVNDHHWSKSRLLEEATGWSFLRDPVRGFSLRRLIRQARVHGFRPGDYIFGGSYFISATCLRTLAEMKLLLRAELGRSLLEEDHIFGLLAKAAAMDLADFSTGDHPTAMEVKRLPCAPEELVARKKKITHSVRRWEHLGEADIRLFFRRLRIPSPLEPPAP